MANLLKGLFGGQQAVPSASHVAVGDADFADFAGAPDPSPVSVASLAASQVLSSAVTPTATGGGGGGFFGGPEPLSARPYTKWYRVWERASIADFYTELFILPFLIIVIVVHFWGTTTNKKKAKSWGAAHIPVIQQEYASVGFSNRSTIDVNNLDSPSTLQVREDALRERASNEYLAYATGRQNVAFLDIRLALKKRYNPMAIFAEEMLGLFFESMPAPKERMEATTFTFDGNETSLVGAEAAKGTKSAYDGFVWAIVHKDVMNVMRTRRYDLSLTYTKDSPKLPNWATVMSESAEITDALLTPELVDAVKQAGEALEALIITDQPLDKPVTLDDFTSKKRITLFLRFPSSGAWSTTLPLFKTYLRLPDTLANIAHFRPEVLKRVRATRDEEVKKLKKLDTDEKAEERKLQAEKSKKQERDAKLKGLTSEQQKKFLEKERAKEFRKSQMKGARKG